MARIRTIKPEFFTSEDIVGRSPIARLFYVALWCEADRAGRMEWKPGTFKLRYLPGDDVTVDAVAQELIDAGLIVVYEVDGKRYAEIPSFEKHQVINNREASSAIPTRAHASATRAPRVKGSSARTNQPSSPVKAEGKGKEGKEGKEPVSDDPAGFAEFWNSWPKSERKQDRKKCAEKWAARGLNAQLHEILADIATKKQTQKWQGGFIEAPEVYLNNDRWRDGVSPLIEGESLAEWHETAGGIKARGAELGIPYTSDDEIRQFSAYRARVFKAAGFVPAAERTT